MPASTYMGLSLPTPSLTVGPAWASMLNSALTTIDAHNHTPGSGQQVPSAGLNINADLPFNGFNLTLARTLRLQQQAAAPADTSDAGCVYVTTAGDLWYNNGAGQHVQITSGSALSAASLGGISGLSGTSAAAAYSAGSGTFAFTSAANTAAILDGGPIVIRDTVASALGVTVKSPASLAAAYTLTLPTGLPAATLPVSMSATGQLSVAAITTAQLATGAITRGILPAVGQQVSGSSGAYSSGSTTFADVTNLSVSITTTGRPVLLILQPATTTGDGGNGFSGPGSGTGDQATFQLLRGATVVASWQTKVSNSNPISFGPVLDAPAAGTYTYKLQAKTGLGGAGSATAIDMVLVAYEL